MKFDCYISEMSISERHGGGLTLLKVLDEDLAQIKAFIHLSHFATKYPASNRILARTVDFPRLTEHSAIRRLIGCSASDWIQHRRFMARRHAKRVAAYISNHVNPGAKCLSALFCPQGVESLYCAEKLRSLRNLQYVTWIMDDHLVKWDGNGWIYPVGVSRLLENHLKDASKVYVISPTMAEFYRSKFGVESKVLFSPADVVEQPVWARPVNQERIRLGYFGALWQWQADALSMLVKWLQVMNAELDIYSSNTGLPSNLGAQAVTFKGQLLPGDVSKRMRSYDAVVLPASFTERLRNMSEFNVATKMSECLASGTVTLLIAPRYAAMHRLLRANAAAILITEDTREAFENAAAQLRSDTARCSVLQSAASYVSKALCTAAMRETWRSAFEWA